MSAANLKTIFYFVCSLGGFSLALRGSGTSGA